MFAEPIILEGRWVRLEPLEERHIPDLLAVADDAEIWRYLSAALTSAENMQAWLAEAQALQRQGAALPFAIIEQASGQAIGSTRYLDIRPHDRGIEIGWTWLARRAWRTAVNSECKFLLLSHAFERLGCIRVQIKTHHLNERSQRAIQRIGGTFEGILRQQVIMPDGSYRSSVYYSILDNEWPPIKARLHAGLYAG